MKVSIFYNDKNKYCNDMENDILEILQQYKFGHIPEKQALKELLNLFPVIKCRCIHEIEERFPSELINKKCNDCGGVL